MRSRNRWTRLGPIQVLGVLISVMVILTSPATADLKRGLHNYLDILEGRKRVESLSAEEAREVLDIHRRLQGLGSSGRIRGGGLSRPTYRIEVSHNDDLFVINGEKFSAKTYCFNFDEGDEVMFIEGSASGACASAKILNLRTKQVCEVWCE
jgi:hypothetical protein